MFFVAGLFSKSTCRAASIRPSEVSRPSDPEAIDVGRRNQVAEAALGQGVLVRENCRVRSQVWLISAAPNPWRPSRTETVPSHPNRCG